MRVGGEGEGFGAGAVEATDELGVEVVGFLVEQPDRTVMATQFDVEAVEFVLCDDERVPVPAT